MVHRILLLLIVVLSALPAYGQAGFDQLLQKANQKVFSEPDSALFFLRQAGAIATRANDAVALGKTALTEGRVMYVKGDFEKALVLWRRADSLYMMSGFTEGRRSTLNNLGLIYGAWSEHDIAIDYYRSAAAMAQAASDTTMILNVNYNLAISLRETGRVDSAIVLFNLNTERARLPAYRLQKARAHMMLSDGLFRIGKTDSALAQALRAKALFRPEDAWDWGFLMGLLARIYERNGDHKAAIEAGETGLKVQLRLGARWELYQLYRILASAYEGTGNTAKAYSAMKLHAAYGDSVFSDRNKKELFRSELNRKERTAARLALENAQKTTQLRAQQMGLALLLVLFSGALIGLYLRERTNRETSQLNKELEKSNAALTRLNHFKNELLSIVGHDMANMMTSVTGFLELYTTRAINRVEFEQALPLLEENLVRIQLTFNNLFRWAETQLGGFSAAPEEIDTKAFLDSFKELFATAAAKRDIALFVETTSAVPVRFDPNHLHLVLRNLVHNALKFTPNGGQITLYAGPVSNGSMRIGVRDTGCGITIEIQDRLLQSDQRISTAGARKEAGTGLGLQTTKKLLALHETTLEILSAPGKGADFYFQIRV
jgi:signal transduction histidine kinase